MEITEEQVLKWMEAIELDVIEKRGRLNALGFILAQMKKEDEKDKPAVEVVK